MIKEQILFDSYLTLVCGLAGKIVIYAQLDAATVTWGTMYPVRIIRIYIEKHKLCYEVFAAVQKYVSAPCIKQYG